jgi:hypothetical protein
MDLTTLLAILGVMFTCVGAGAVAYNSISQRISVIETKQNMRDRFFEELERRAMELLHRDDNKWGLDKLVEKYRLNHYDLSMNDWILLKEKCEEIFQDNTNSTDERLLASLAIGLAEHKLPVIMNRKPFLKT